MTQTAIRTETMPADKRQSAARDFQDTLVELLDLTLITKHCHWNIHGNHFRAVHLQLDDIFDDLRAWSDLVAERIVSLGVTAHGQARDLAHSGIEPVAEAFLLDAHVIAGMAERLAASATRMRERAERLQDTDLVSQNILLDVIQGMEKHIWMLKAQVERER